MLVEFIIPTYHRLAPLSSMLASLVAQNNNNWKANVIIDGKDHLDEISKIVTSFNDLRIKYTVTDDRYNDWGHTPREIGKQASDAKYIIMSGDDNYYIPIFVEELQKASINNPGLIYWDMVHSHYNYSYFKCHPAFNQIDMGAFATRKDLAQQIELGKDYAADGLFIENFKKKFPEQQMIKIDKVLFVHN